MLTSKISAGLEHFDSFVKKKVGTYSYQVTRDGVGGWVNGAWDSDMPEHSATRFSPAVKVCLSVCLPAVKHAQTLMRTVQIPTLKQRKLYNCMFLTRNT